MIQLLNAALQQTSCALSAEPIDWTRLFQLAHSHSIANTLYYAVKELTAEISEPFRMEWLRSVQIGTIQKLETDSIFKQLNAEHIRYVPLKGYVLKNLYPSPEMRSMGDIDVLIDAENMPRVSKIMTDLGFTPDANQGGGNHYSFDKEPFVHIEFHHSLFDTSSPFSEYFNPGWQFVAVPYECENLSSTTATLTPTLQLTPEGFYIFMLGHLASHFISGGSGIRSVMDVWVYNQHYEHQLDWTFINSEFNRAGLLRFAQNIKDLSDAWFGTKEPTALMDEMGDYITGSGTYGTSEQAALSEVLKSDNQTVLGLRKIKAFTKRVFLPLKEMRFRYAFLNKLPFFLPVGWMLRGIRVLATRKDLLKSWVNNVSTVQAAELEHYKQKFQRFGF